jgi:hypothetical protein
VSYLLPQWLEYHIALGISHIFIVDNCSDDNGLTEFWEEFYVNNGGGKVTIIKNCGDNRTQKVGNLLLDKAKPLCLWTTLIDVDEYLFPSLSLHADDYSASLASASASATATATATVTTKSKSVNAPKVNLLDEIFRRYEFVTGNSVKPLVRMPWFQVGTQGREKRVTDKLIIDAYIDGDFATVKKTFAQTKYLKTWGNSHHPEKFDFFSPHIDGKPLREYSRPFYIQPHEMESKSKSKSTSSSFNCTVPKSPLFVRHYQGLSYEDFNIIRVPRPVDTEGSPNPFKGRKDWEALNFASPPQCHPHVGEEFRSHMSALTLLGIRNRLQVQLGKTDSKNIEESLSSWFQGSKIAN